MKLYDLYIVNDDWDANTTIFNAFWRNVIVYQGNWDDMPSKFQNMELTSFETENGNVRITFKD